MVTLCLLTLKVSVWPAPQKGADRFWTSRAEFIHGLCVVGIGHRKGVCILHVRTDIPDQVQLVRGVYSPIRKPEQVVRRYLISFHDVFLVVGVCKSPSDPEGKSDDQPEHRPEVLHYFLFLGRILSSNKTTRIAITVPTMTSVLVQSPCRSGTMACATTMSLTPRTWWFRTSGFDGSSDAGRAETQHPSG